MLSKEQVMSLKVFCPECGAKYEYTLKCPNFCKHCREPLTAAAAKLKPLEDIEEKSQEEIEPAKPLTAIEKFRQKRLAKVEQNNDEDEDEGEEQDEAPTIKTGTIEVNVAKVKKETLKSLAVGEKDLDIQKREPGLLSTKSKKQFLKDFQKLAGTSRRQ